MGEGWKAREKWVGREKRGSQEYKNRLRVILWRGVGGRSRGGERASCENRALMVGRVEKSLESENRRKNKCDKQAVGHQQEFYTPYPHTAVLCKCTCTRTHGVVHCREDRSQTCHICILWSQEHARRRKNTQSITAEHLALKVSKSQASQTSVNQSQTQWREEPRPFDHPVMRKETLVSNQSGHSKCHHLMGGWHPHW